MDTSAQAVERSARGSTSFERMVRVGLVTYALVHLFVAGLSVRLAFTGHRMTSQGALAQLADDAWGLLVVVILAASFAGLAVWQLLVALVGYRDLHGRRRALMRAGAGTRAVTYGYLSYATGSLLVHRHSPAGSGASPKERSAEVLSQPLGRTLLLATGLVIVAVGIGIALFGITGKFLEQLDEEALTGQRRRPIVSLGYVGYVAKGAAFLVVGLFVAWAGVTDDPRQSGGLDQSLEHLLGGPWGTAAVGLFGAGLGCFGLYLLARARHFRRRTLTA